MRSLAAVLLALSFLPAASALDNPLIEYGARAAKLSEKELLAQLADFCEENLLTNGRSPCTRQAAEPDYAEAHCRLDEVSPGLGSRSRAEAKETAEKQAKGLTLYGAKWVPEKEAAKLRDADRKAEGWDLDFRLEVPGLLIFSSRPLAFTRKVAGILSNEIETYRRFYGALYKLEPKPKPLRIYLIGDRKVYESKWKQDTAEEPDKGTTGFYYPKNTTLYIGESGFYPPGEQDWLILKTAVHELVHQMDHLLAHQKLPDTSAAGAEVMPPWVCEGRAHYFAHALVGRQILPGACVIHPKDTIVKELGDGIEGVPLSSMLDLTYKSFSEKQARAPRSPGMVPSTGEGARGVVPDLPQRASARARRRLRRRKGPT